VSIVRNGIASLQGWVGPDQELIIPGEKPLFVSLRQKSMPLSFDLTLKDFRKTDYPGTGRAASFESDVALADKHEKTEIHKTIRMNQPLDYANYRIFQSSYVQNESVEGSVFTVAKNPGIPLIYGGSIILFIGIFLTFFVPPISSFHR